MISVSVGDQNVHARGDAWESGAGRVLDIAQRDDEMLRVSNIGEVHGHLVRVRARARVCSAGRRRRNCGAALGHGRVAVGSDRSIECKDECVGI